MLSLQTMMLPWRSIWAVYMVRSLLRGKVGKVALSLGKAKLINVLGLGHVMAAFQNEIEVLFTHGQGVKVFALSV
jgi:hypothetical protein